MDIKLHHNDLPDGLDLGDCIAVDTETRGLNPHRDRLCLIQLSAGDGTCHLVKFGRDGFDAPNLKAQLADPARIQVMRPNKQGELVRRMTIDLNKMVQEGDTRLDAVLEEGDIIFVPPNPLAAVGLGLQQLLLPIQPAANTVKGPADIADYYNGRPYKSEPD